MLTVNPKTPIFFKLVKFFKDGDLSKNHTVRHNSLKFLDFPFLGETRERIVVSAQCSLPVF